ncbi:tyrosine-protein kinase fyna, partial [Biomphalaria glabrata]
DNQSVPLTDSFVEHLLEDIEILNSDIKLTDIVGEGNFSIVRRGYLNKRDEVAVKSLRPHTISPKQFLYEALLLRRLDHPKIVK